MVEKKKDEVKKEVEKLEKEKKEEKEDKKRKEELGKSKILDAAARKLERDEKAAKKREEKRRYERLKAAIFEQEKINDKKIILFRSGENWWKMGGSSALFYATLVAPRLKEEVKARLDTDFHSKFVEGVISVPDIEGMKKKMGSLGLKIVFSDDEKIEFELEGKVNKATIKKLKAVEELKIKSLNQDLVVMNSMPEMYDAIEKTVELALTYFGNLNKVVYDMFGKVSLDLIREMLLYVYLIELGKIEKEKGMKEIVLRTERVKLYLKVMMNIRKIGVNGVSRLAMQLIKIERLAKA